MNAFDMVFFNQKLEKIVNTLEKLTIVFQGLGEQVVKNSIEIDRLTGELEKMKGDVNGS